MNIWFVSDTHFGEQPKKRQRLSGMTADELDALIERNWRRRVQHGDTVWHLGDVGKNWRLVGELPGVKHLILAHEQDRRAGIRRSEIFKSINEGARLSTESTELLLVHNPDGVQASRGEIVIRGHHHYDPPAPGHRSACVDHNDWGPVSLEDLLSPDR